MKKVFIAIAILAAVIASGCTVTAYKWTVIDHGTGITYENAMVGSAPVGGVLRIDTENGAIFMSNWTAVRVDSSHFVPFLPSD